MIRAALALVLCSMALPVLGNGAISEFPAGGVVFKEANGIAMAREDLFVSPNAVRVTYTFRNDAGAAQDVTMGFPMPAVPMSGDVPDYLGGSGPGDIDPRNYMNFEITSDGHPAAATLHEYATVGGRDIEPVLSAHGLPLFLPAESMDVLLALGPEMLAELAADGVIDWNADYPEYASPLWEYQAVYEWQQAFAPGETTVEIAYRPLVGLPGDFADIYERGDMAESYCVDDAVRAGLDRKKAEGRSYEPLTLTYILTTANHWTGPIGDFRLTVSKADAQFPELSADDILVAFCPASARKTGPTTFEWTARDFVPSEELRVVWYYFWPAAD